MLSHRPVDVIRLGSRLRLTASKNVSERRILFNETFFDLDERSFLTSKLPMDAVFIDAGANIGGYSFHIAHTRPLSRVIAIEAHPTVFQRLWFNVRQNPGMQIVPIHCALAGESGEVNLFINDKNLGENSIRIVSPSGGFMRVQAKTLLQVLSENDIDHIDAIKLDIEGVEYDVLREFFTSAHTSLFPMWMLIERPKADAKMLYDLCADHGYELYAEFTNNLVFHRRHP